MYTSLGIKISAESINEAARQIADAIDTAQCNGYLDAILILEKKRDDFDSRYLAKDRVSMQQIAARDDFIAKCNWAIEILRSNIQQGGRNGASENNQANTEPSGV